MARCALARVGDLVHLGIADAVLQIRTRQFDVFGRRVLDPLHRIAREPAATTAAGIFAFAATTEPAPISDFAPTTASLRITALLPMSAPFSMMQSSMTAQCPIVQSSPMSEIGR